MIELSPIQISKLNKKNNVFVAVCKTCGHIWLHKTDSNIFKALFELRGFELMVNTHNCE
jgi:hypothetical protein